MTDAERARVIEALEPFARLADRHEAHEVKVTEMWGKDATTLVRHEDDADVACSSEVRYGDCKRARALRDELIAARDDG